MSLLLCPSHRCSRTPLPFAAMLTLGSRCSLYPHDTWRAGSRLISAAPHGLSALLTAPPHRLTAPAHCHLAQPGPPRLTTHSSAHHKHWTQQCSLLKPLAQPSSLTPLPVTPLSRLVSFRLLSSRLVSSRLVSSRLVSSPTMPLSSDKWTCPHCGKVGSLHNRARHLQKQHPDQQEKGLQCSLCPAEVKDAAQLQLHTRSCPGLQKASPSSSPASRSSHSSPSLSPTPLASPSVAPRIRAPAIPCSFSRHELHSACEPFLLWLGESPQYEFERTLKTELMLAPKQLDGPRADLCTAMKFADTTQLPLLLACDNVQRYLESIESSDKGATRRYALCHVLRKALAFLFSEQSRAANAVITIVDSN